MSKSIPTTEAPVAPNRKAARMRSGALVKAWERDEKGALPEIVPAAFLKDVVAYTRMFYSGGVACSVHGREHQEDMAVHWPREWMLWLFDEVGAHTYDDRMPTEYEISAYRWRQAAR